MRTPRRQSRRAGTTSWPWRLSLNNESQHTRPRTDSVDQTPEASMTQHWGVLLAIVSSALGGTAAAVTRYLVASADPITMAILRWVIGFLCLLPIALLLRVRWPQRRDWPGVA